METKHTPGPWHVSADGIQAGPEDAFRPFGGCGCCGSPWMMAKEEGAQQADANLIVAAPELFELVQTANDGLRGSHTKAWQEKASAVIAKVTGSAQ